MRIGIGYTRAGSMAIMSKRNENEPKIEADFEVIRVQTMSSNAIRITLEMPEHMIPQMGMFAECQRSGIYLHGEFTAKEKSQYA